MMRVASYLFGLRGTGSCIRSGFSSRLLGAKHFGKQSLERRLDLSCICPSVVMSDFEYSGRTHFKSDVLDLIPPSKGPRAFHPSGTDGRDETYDLRMFGRSASDISTPSGV